MATEASMKFKGVLIIAMLAIAEAQQVMQNARFNSARSSNRVKEFDLEAMMSNPNFQEHAKLAGEKISDMMANANLQEGDLLIEQLQALTRDPSFQEQAKRFAEEMEKVTASPKLEEQMKLFAEHMEGMQANPIFKEHTSHVAQQMEEMMANKNPEEQGKIFAEQLGAMMTSAPYQEQVERVTKHVEAILADPSLQQQALLLAEKMKAAPTFKKQEETLADQMSSWIHAEEGSVEKISGGNFADKLTNNMVDTLFDGAFKMMSVANAVAARPVGSIAAFPSLSSPVSPLASTRPQSIGAQVMRPRFSHVTSAAAVAAPAAASAMTIFLEQIAPKLGTVIANVMFMTSVPPVLEARKNNALGELNPIPFAVIVANCAAWVAYGLLISNPYILLSNAPGMILGLFYTMTGVRLADANTRKTVETMLLTFVSIITASGMVSSLILTDQAARAALAGYVANAFVFFYYGSPLSTLGKVLKEKSSASLYAPLIAVNVLNGGFWTGYGLAVKDLYVAVPNGVGVILGAIQLFLCGIFPSKKKD